MVIVAKLGYIAGQSSIEVIRISQTLGIRLCI